MIVFTDAIDCLRAYEPNEYKPPMTSQKYLNEWQNWNEK